MRVLVVAPHPDDESLGCGGTLLRFRRERPETEIHWVIVTEMKAEWGYSPERVAKRKAEIESVASRLRPAGVYHLGFQPAHLDTVPISDVISKLGGVVSHVRPDTVLVPWRHDVHTDHGVVFNAVAASTKTFRYPFVRTILAYETLSETDFALDTAVSAFQPNVWLDISGDLDGKLDLVGCYSSEFGEFPFPRSKEAIISLARMRGVAAGVVAAEAFVLLKGIF